jgi:spermidine/putrescine-binding protein
MASIIGERWRNADSSSLDTSIASVTTELNNATMLYNQALTAIARCNNQAIGCVAKTGRHISTWRDQRDKYAPLVVRYKAQLEDLLKLKEQVSAQTAQSAQSQQLVAAANTAIAEAESSGVQGKLKTYLLIGVIAAVVVISGVYIFKKLKK